MPSPSAAPPATAANTNTCASVEILSTDLFHLDEHELLVISDIYSKMLIVQWILPSQCNSAKVISIPTELFGDLWFLKIS